MDYDGVLGCLRLADDRIPELLELAHEVRRRWCGEEVEVEGIVSLKTGGCPEDCHCCSQSGRFPTPVRAALLELLSAMPLPSACVREAGFTSTELEHISKQKPTSGDLLFDLKTAKGRHKALDLAGRRGFARREVALNA